MSRYTIAYREWPTPWLMGVRLDDTEQGRASMRDGMRRIWLEGCPLKETVKPSEDGPGVAIIWEPDPDGWAKYACS